MITDTGGVVYTILSIDPPNYLSKFWRAHCVSLMVLGHQITWTLPTPATDTFKSPLVNRAGTLGPYDAAIHEQEREPIVFQGVVQGFRRAFSIWTVKDEALPMGTIGRDQNGITYTVRSIRNRKRLEELPEADCVIEP
jgi:hypothetical protein